MNCQDCNKLTCFDCAAELRERLEKATITTFLTETDMGYQNFAWTCENCKSEWVCECGTPEENSYKYCPNCGAKITEYIPYRDDEAGLEG